MNHDYKTRERKSGMKLTRRGQVIIYPIIVLAFLTLMGLAGWIEGGM